MRLAAQPTASLHSTSPHNSTQRTTKQPTISHQSPLPSPTFPHFHNLTPTTSYISSSLILNGFYLHQRLTSLTQNTTSSSSSSLSVPSDKFPRSHSYLSVGLFSSTTSFRQIRHSVPYRSLTHFASCAKYYDHFRIIPFQEIYHSDTKNNDKLLKCSGVLKLTQRFVLFVPHILIHPIL